MLTKATFAARPKDCVCIVGEGGSGKSTILKLLVRAEDPTTGTVEVDGISLLKVPPTILQLYRRRLGIMFQEPTLLMQSSVEENIALPLELVHAPAHIIDRAVGDIMKRLGLDSLRTRLAESLSMSERVLVAVARAIVTNPMIVVADEPLQHLDAKQSKTVVEVFAALQKRGTTVILFSRSTEVARAFGARVLALKNGAISAAAEPQGTMNHANTHRILEETEDKVHQVLEHPPVIKPRPGTPKNDKKIRITSIGSGL